MLTVSDPRKTWRSTFWFMAGLSAATFLGGMLSFDADKPSTERDRCVVILSIGSGELTVLLVSLANVPRHTSILDVIHLHTLTDDSLAICTTITFVLRL